MKAMDDAGRQFLVEALKTQPEMQLLQEMVSRGYDIRAVRATLASVQQAQQPQAVPEAATGPVATAKRDWVLALYRKLFRQSGFQLDRRDKLSREDFYAQYYFQNRPVIITGMLDDWAACSRWSFDYLRQRCGHQPVQVQFNREEDRDYEINKGQHEKTMLFRDFVDRVEATGASNDCYMTAYNQSHNRQALRPLWLDFTQLPEYLANDPINDGFFWMGPRGVFTPLHHDLTNNFMAQVKGRKKVVMAPAFDLPNVYNFGYCYSRANLEQTAHPMTPLIQDACRLSCELQPGELLFLPVGWWHQVESLEATITLTFTNFQADNDFISFYPAFDRA